uniref:Uncharacterized protein n=1 Tax=uncultured marine virus TaxID=186617 RepID=A0A0F7L6X5_9VIRU|nr:hypothetical protein [uncultured marine virus]
MPSSMLYGRRQSIGCVGDRQTRVITLVQTHHLSQFDLGFQLTLRFHHIEELLLLLQGVIVLTRIELADDPFEVGVGFLVRSLAVHLCHTDYREGNGVTLAAGRNHDQVVDLDRLVEGFEEIGCGVLVNVFAIWLLDVVRTPDTAHIIIDEEYG